MEEKGFRNYKIKNWIIIILLASSIVLSFALPRGVKYTGINFIPDLKLPYKMSGWQGKDVDMRLNTEDDRYNFIGEVIARGYANKNGENLLLLILNARDFHYPNVCFTSSGFEVRELNKTEFHASDRTFKAHTIYTEKTRKKEKFLIIYWIIIDKKLVPNWVEQKIKQLFFSLFNKKSVGLMVRLDIPVKDGNIKNGLTRAKQFVSDLRQALPQEQADYIFGEIK